MTVLSKLILGAAHGKLHSKELNSKTTNELLELEKVNIAPVS